MKQLSDLRQNIRSFLLRGLVIGNLAVSLSGYSQTYVSETFSSSTGSTPPSGWANVLGSNPNANPAQLWEFDNPGGRTITGANFDADFAILDSDNYGSGNEQDAYLVTPAFSTIGNSMVKLKFSESFRQYTGSSCDIEVTNDGGTTWNNIRALNTNLGYPYPAVQTELDISAFAGNQAAVQVRFHYVGDYGYWWAIDNLQIYTPSAVDLAVTKLLAPGIIGCYTANQNIAVELKNEGSLPMDFSTSPATITVNVTGAATANPSIVVNSGTLAVGDSITVLVTSTFDMTASGTYTFSSTVSVSGDLNTGNDTLVKNITKTPLASFPETVDFTGFTGFNLTTVFPRWYETTGLMPDATNTTSLWTSRNFANDATSPNGIAAVVNLNYNSQKEWIIGPRFLATPNTQLHFDLALTTYYGTSASNLGSDDSLVVMISTDCGLTWLPAQVYDAASTISNTGQQEVVDLSPFAGQEIIIGFYASEGTTDDPEDSDVFIDNINIVNVLATDVGASVVVPPAASAGGCYSNTEVVQARIKNYGLNTIDFSVTPVQVEVTITGASTQTYNATINSGTLTNNTDTLITVTTVANMSTTGTYNFRARTILASDQQTPNDTSAVVQRVHVPLAPLPMTVNFTGYTSNNLSTVFPGWSEGNGAFPTLNDKNDASWFSGNFGYVPNPPASTSAYINIYNTGDQEWIISPKFRPTAATQLEFDLALTLYSQTNPGNLGSDDTIMVAISTDCGLSFNQLVLYDASSTISNTGQTETISLAPYAGQDVIIAFYGSEGTVDDPEDVNVYIDNINVRELLPVDLAAGKRISPVKGVTCFTNAEPVVVQIKNTGSQSIDFSVNPAVVTTTVTGATTTTLTQTVNAGTLASNATLDVTLTGTIDMSAYGSYYLRSYVSCTGDAVAGNDSLNFDTLAHVAPAVMPQTLNFTGYTGSNLSTLYPGWFEATGYPVPNATLGSEWMGTNFTNQVTANGTGIRVNLYNLNTRSWFISPKVTATAATELTFDLAVTAYAGTGSSNMGSDDSLVVFVSTDCGLTYNPVHIYDASSTISNTGQAESFSLSAYAGQNIIIGFYATEGVVDDIEDFDIHIDNINIKDRPANDVGVIEVLMPQTGCGHTANDSVKVVIRNFGSQPASGFDISYVINTGTPVTENIGAQIVLPGQDLVYAFVTTANLATTGSYGIKSYTTLTGDATSSNDTVSGTILATGVVSTFPYYQDFEGALTDWLVQPMVGSNNWGILSGGLTNPTLPAYSGTKIAYWNSYSIASGNISRLYAPCMDFSGMNNPTVQFFFSQDPQGSSSEDRVRVLMSLDKGETWTVVDSVMRYNAALSGPQWTKYRACLSSAANNPVVMIALEAVSDNGYNIGVDDFFVFDFTGAMAGVPTVMNNNICQGSTVDVMIAGSNSEYTYTLAEAGSLSPRSITMPGTGGTFNIISVALTSNTDLVLVVTDSLTGCYAIVSLGQITVNTNNLSGTINAPTAASVSIPVAIDATGTTGATFSWDFGTDATPATATGQGPHNVAWSSIGTKTVTLTLTQNGCTLVVTQTVTVGTTAIANSLTENSVSVYPNPTNGKISISLGVKQGEKIQIEMADLSGKIIYNQEIISKNQVDLDLTQLPAGLYFLKLNYQGSQLTQKLVIE